MDIAQSAQGVLDGAAAIAIVLSVWVELGLVGAGSVVRQRCL
jgi:hypothetical protein